METYNKNDGNVATINYVTIFFMNNISHYDLTPYFNIVISSNVIDDYIKYDKPHKHNPDFEYDGLTILPCNPQGKIQILISENSCIPITTLHELTHMYDFVSFSNRFCNGELHNVKQHKYYQVLVYWSEFHAKLVDIPYCQKIIDTFKNVSDDKILYDFTSQINSFYYPGYTKKFLDKQNVGIKDIMWYLGELVVCNLYDKNNTYYLPESIISVCSPQILQLYDLVSHCLTFDDFANNVEAFRILLQ